MMRTMTRRPRLHTVRRLEWTGEIGRERAEYRGHLFALSHTGVGAWTLTVELPRGGRRVTEHRSGPDARREAMTFAQSL